MRTALAGEDVDAIRDAMETLSERMQEIGQAVYGAASADGAGPDRRSGRPESAQAATRVSPARSRASSARSSLRASRKLARVPPNIGGTLALTEREIDRSPLYLASLVGWASARGAG